LGNIALSQRETSCAQSYFEESLALSRDLGEKVGIVASLQSLGQLMITKNDYESARILYKESLDLAKDLAAAQYVSAANDALEKCTREMSEVNR
jgi:tetratricopeptide (TPR) repeat protein